MSVGIISVVSSPTALPGKYNCRIFYAATSVSSLQVHHILRDLLIIRIARQMGSKARACVAAAALATRGGRTDVDHLVLMEAFAENGSSDVVAGAHRGGSVLRWQALSEAGDADDPARRFVAECSLK